MSESRQHAEYVAPKQRRGWLHMACYDVAMRDQLRLIPTAFPGKSALDVLDGLVDIIDRQEALMR